MATEINALYTCDKCGTWINHNKEFGSPEGWVAIAGVVSDRTRLTPHYKIGHLCPVCVDVIRQWIKDGVPEASDG